MSSAVIDAGSNTFRLLIGYLDGGRPVRIRSERRVTRLARGLGQSQLLGEKGIESSLAALRDFSSEIRSLGVRTVRAVGTSALREAQNGAEFVRMACQECGIEIEIISGRREAELTAKGVVAGFEPAPKEAFIADIGGGSTEWIVLSCTESTSAVRGSIPIGVVKLSEAMVAGACDSASLHLLIDPAFEPALESAAALRRPPLFIGTGGTVTTLASIDLGLADYDPARVHGHTMHTDRLDSLYDMLSGLPAEERRRVPGLDSGREDLIIPGVLLTMRLARLLGCGSVTASDYGLLEGLLKEIGDEKGL